MALLATPLSWAFGVALFVYRNVLDNGTLLRNALADSTRLGVGVAETALLAGAVLLLAVAALRSRALGRWTFVPFVIVSVYPIPLLFWAAYSLGLEVPGWMALSAPLLRAPLWVLLGAALWRKATRLGTTSDRAAPGGRTDEAGDG